MFGHNQYATKALPIQWYTISDHSIARRLLLPEVNVAFLIGSMGQTSKKRPIRREIVSCEPTEPPLKRAVSSECVDLSEPEPASATPCGNRNDIAILDTEDCTSASLCAETVSNSDTYIASVISALSAARSPDSVVVLQNTDSDCVSRVQDEKSSRLRASSRYTEGAEIAHCFVCSENLTTYEWHAREVHLNACLDKQDRITDPKSADESHEVIQEANLEEAQSLRATALCCVLCGCDISRRGLFARCFHIKKCARERNISVKKVLEMMQDGNADEGETDVVATSAVHTLVASSDTTTKTTINEMLMHNARNSVKHSESADRFKDRKDSIHSKGEKSAPKGINDMLMTAARESASRASDAESTAKSRNGRGRKWGSNRGKWNHTSTRGSLEESSVGNIYVPDYKKVQFDGMSIPIIVDGFHYASATVSDTYFLTHFHSVYSLFLIF